LRYQLTADCNLSIKLYNLKNEMFTFTFGEDTTSYSAEAIVSFGLMKCYQVSNH